MFGATRSRTLSVPRLRPHVVNQRGFFYQHRKGRSNTQEVLVGEPGPFNFGRKRRTGDVYKPLRVGDDKDGKWAVTLAVLDQPWSITNSWLV